MKSTPIRELMTWSPITVEASASLEEAEALMEEHGLRHLPVLRDRCLVGVLSDADLARAPALEGRRAERVEDLMARAPYAVDPETPIDQALATMAAHRLGCVIVRGHGAAVSGVFTTTDAVRLLGELLRAKAEAEGLGEAAVAAFPVAVADPADAEGDGDIESEYYKI